MTTIRIGELTLAVARSAEADAAIVATTGCAPAELAQMLGPRAAPGQIARALAPLLTVDDVPAVGELAEAIAAADLQAVRRQVVALLAAPPSRDQAEG